MPEHPLWTPDPARVAAARLTAFRQRANERHGLKLATFNDLHAWSIDHMEAFWDLVWDFCGIKGEKGDRVVVDGDKMPGARFFPDAWLNFAENLLKHASVGDALVFRGENQASSRWTWDQLRQTVSRAQQAMKAAGVGKGDRVAAMMPNIPETVVLMLAAASLGAVWSSCSPDFGERGVLDRFGQIEPKLFIAADGYWYNGKRLSITEKLQAITRQLPSVHKTVIVSYLGDAEAVAADLPQAETFESFIAPFAPQPLTFEQLPFDHPLYILYSSGTTGIPKCIVHSAGGALLQHVKEQQLHCDIKPNDRVFYFTTCGWMMWNWIVSALASGATLLLYDGSPFAPDGNVLFDYAQAERATLFGTSAKYIDSCHKANLAPIATHDLSSVRVLTSTGSPLAPESFEYVYRAIKSDLHLASISGGTDIVGCFVAGDPTSPVWAGEIQAPGLAMAVDIWSDEGKPLREEKGELVCTRPFPSMPVMFWNDPDGKKYHAAYFERFPGIWCHGDFAEWTRHGGIIIYGRSDATLNPGGVRIGTAEIYAQVEQIPEVVEAIAIGQNWDNDVRVVLFVRLREGLTLDDALRRTITQKIRTGASPRHVPARIIQVADIPRTKSGKITELAVRDVVHGRPIKNTEALANPEALDYFCDLPDLRR